MPTAIKNSKIDITPEKSTRELAEKLTSYLKGGEYIFFEHRVIPVRPDEPQVVLGRALNKLVMNPLEAAGLRWPWFAGSR